MTMTHRESTTDTAGVVPGCPSWCATDHGGVGGMGFHQSERISVVNVPGASRASTTVQLYRCGGDPAPRIAINGVPCTLDAATRLAQVILRLTDRSVPEG